MPPELLYRRFLPLMPNVGRLLSRSRYGVLKSTDPPITVPAWLVMFSGVDPGSLGLYGFRHRRIGSYTETYLPTPDVARYPAVWDLLSARRDRVCVIGVPPGYPPPHVNGVYVSDLLTPPGAPDFVWPPEIAAELLGVGGGYDFDVPFRGENRSQVADEIRDMTRRRFAVARHLWAKEAWRLFILHEIGPDRIHHTFWKFFDPSHPRHEHAPGFVEAVESYYSLLDAEIGALLDLVPHDVAVWIVSDHGSQAMTGGFCVNEWLMRSGYLKLKKRPTEARTPIEKAAIDWRNTSAWAWGGYYARIFFNIRGREPEGVVDERAIPDLIHRLTRDLEQVRLPDGSLLSVKVSRPSDLFQQVRGDAPDLIVYFGDLKWRSLGSVGHGGVFSDGNDVGPDDSVHSFDGVLVFADPHRKASGPLPDQSILDVAPTLLSRLEVPLPAHLQGQPIGEISNGASLAFPTGSRINERIAGNRRLAPDRRATA